jgi:hypothetical protein
VEEDLRCLIISGTNRHVISLNIMNCFTTNMHFVGFVFCLLVGVLIDLYGSFAVPDSKCFIEKEKF